MHIISTPSVYIMDSSNCQYVEIYELGYKNFRRTV